MREKRGRESDRVFKGVAFSGDYVTDFELD
jgi:hypothetical protein